MSTILIIEDDNDINGMLSKLLEKNGYETKSAYSGTEGVLLHGPDIDLVLLDLMLPGKSGEQIIGELKGTMTMCGAASLKDITAEKIWQG